MSSGSYLDDKDTSVLNEDAVSLQSAFESFRQRKSQELKLQRVLAEKSLCQIRSRSEEEKINLRVKFVETALRYVGVPYHQKYKDPEAPLAPLYLDW